MQGTEYEKPENFLEKTRAIFAEREKEFQLRQQAFEEKEQNLTMLLRRITSEKNELNAQQEGLNARREEMERKTEALDRRAAELAEQEQRQKNRQERLDEQEKNCLMKHNLELEQVRNEEMKLQRLAEEYRYKLSLLEPGIAEALEHPQPGADMENYVPIEEHQRQLRMKAEEVQKLTAERDELKDAILEMQEERSRLLSRIIELRSSRTEQKQEPESKNGAGYGPSAETGADTGGADAGGAETVQEEKKGPASETEEELTAGVLLSYLKKNKAGYDPLEIRHSEDGELLYAESRGLTYHFLFVEPSAFDIAAERKNSSRLRKQLENYNEKFPGVQFRYDEAEGKVYATGYFTNQMKPYELMKRVQEIADCFRQE